ncbi:hypothetical protein EYB53_019980 [Candidatus Chloroploca sp. M-50]|uniref:Uncharacterized protein n=1 Tax=Candidatus Chloroploca mongolica TaxID=2528176 RepID=A0ABS4DEX4_9CHLR|nr:hypothetical protein [Candidatus Chloroploca mongolica]MBP1468007.1 hypothetical protein [Candidatus Chloroploca mongolica]
MTREGSSGSHTSLTSEELTRQAQANLRRRVQGITTTALGVAGVSTLVLLAAGSVLPFAVGGFTTTVAVNWLIGLGSNALAGWLADWANRAGSKAVWEERDEQEVLRTLATDLQQHLSNNRELQDEVARLLEVVEVLPAAIDALAGQAEQQKVLIEGLQRDLRRSDIIQGRLYRQLIEALTEQTSILRQDISQLSIEQRVWFEAIQQDLYLLHAQITQRISREDRSIVGYIKNTYWREVVLFVAQRARAAPLGPLGVRYDDVIHKIDMILDHAPEALSEVETLVLLTAVAIPHLFEGSENEPRDIDGPHLRALVEKLVLDTNSPPQLEQVFNEIGMELVAVTRGRQGFAVDDIEYGQRSVRGEVVRPQLLSALLHLASTFNIDQVTLRTPPATLMLNSEERILWLRQMYVRSLTVTSKQVQVYFVLPKEFSNQYKPIVVDPLAQEIEELVSFYSYILFSANIYLGYRQPSIIEGMVPVISNEDWQHLKHWIEVRHARRSEERLHHQAWESQRLRDTLIKADVALAEAMETSGEALKAATIFSRVTAWLAQERDAYQAARFARQAARLYTNIGDFSSAVEQYLLLAKVYFQDTLSPELARQEIQEGMRIANNLGSAPLLIQLTLAQARVEFASLSDQNVAVCLLEAKRLVGELANVEEQSLFAQEIALLHARFACIWEDWATARQVLEEVVSAYPPLSRELRLEVLALFLAVLTEWNDSGTADKVYATALELIGDADHRRAGLFRMQYAASLARRGDLEAAYTTYHDALHNLDGVAEQYDLCLLYQNMQSTLLRSSGSFYKGMDKYESTRIDLFNRTKSLNRGYRHEQEAAESLAQGKYRDVMRHLRLALYHYWADGALFSIFGVYQLFASLHETTGKTADALFAALQSGEKKTVVRLSEKIASFGDARIVESIIAQLIQGQPTPRELSLTAAALGALADVAPPAMLDQILNYLIGLTRNPIRVAKHGYTRQEALKSLSEFVPQLNEIQTNLIVRLALELSREPQQWTILDAIIKLLNSCFTECTCRVEPDLYKSVFDFAVTQIGADALNQDAKRLIVHLGRTAPADVRADVESNIRNSARDVYTSLIDLAFLGADIEPETIKLVLNSILESINKKPHTRSEDGKEVTEWHFGGVPPQAVLHLVPVIPLTAQGKVVDGLLQAIINKDNDLGTRSSAAITLSELPLSFIKNREDEVADYLLFCLEENLETASYVSSALASQKDIFSNFVMNLGKVEEVQRNCLRGLGTVYGKISEPRQTRVLHQIVKASRHSNALLRQGASMALDRFDNEQLPSRLLFTLVALLHDQDPKSCSWACAAVARLLERGLIKEYTQDMIERLIDLAKSSSVEVRTGVAVALKKISESGSTDQIVRAEVSTMLAQLMQDISHTVRHEAGRAMKS